MDHSRAFVEMYREPRLLKVILRKKSPFFYFGMRTRRPGLKGGHHQDIIIMYHEIVKPLLNWYLQFKSTRIEDYSKNEYLFVSQRGKTTESYIYQLVRVCSTIIGRNISPRMLRKGLVP